MALPRLALAALLLAATISATVSGCAGDSPGPDSAWREEVDSSLRSLEQSDSFRYRILLETWTGVSGQRVSGDERGEGSKLGDEFSVSISRTFPAGEENLALASLEEGLYLREGEAWRQIEEREALSPLYDPSFFAAFVSSYGSISLEGEEKRSGSACRRYVLHLDGGRAREAVTERAWSYFSDMRWELKCTAWIGGASSPPVALRLEITACDARESLERYRVLATLEPYDFHSYEIELVLPGE